MPGISVSLRNPAIAQAANRLVDGKLNAATMGELVASFTKDAGDALKSGRLPPDQMLPVAQRGLTDRNKEDLTALLGDAAFAAKLTPTASNFLKAVLGLEALRAGGVFEPAGVGVVDKTPARAAVQTLKEWITSGKLQSYYDASIGLSTADAGLKDEALRVFGNLPKIAPGVSATDMVELGLWSVAPRGIERMQESARYITGRQVKVTTNVNANLNAGQEFMTYRADGPVGITARAKIVGEQGDNFLVLVEGKADPITVTKQSIIDLNHPHTYSPGTNYNDPFTKAKICEAALSMADDVAKLDFTKMKTAGRGGLLRGLLGGQAAEEMVAVQMRCFQRVHDVIQMKYSDQSAYNDEARVSFNGDNSGRAAVRGHGVCTDQRQVMRDLAFPFGDLLGFDMRSVTGGVHRHTDRNAPMDQQLRSFSGGAHDWLEVTFRPSMKVTVCDRTWRQVNKPLFEAYGPYGDRYPSGPAYDAKQIAIADTDVRADGSVTVADYEKQFGDANTSGRQGHMTLTGN
jgi:hypothetical protein